MLDLTEMWDNRLPFLFSFPIRQKQIWLEVKKNAMKCKYRKKKLPE